MLPVCSATPCSSYPQIYLNDAFRHLCRSEKAFNIRRLSEVSGLYNGDSLPGVSIQKEAATSLYSDFVGRNALLSNDWRYATGNLSDHLKYVEDSTVAVLQEEYLGDTLIDNADILVEPSTEGSISIPDTFNVGADKLLNSNPGIENFRSQMNDSIEASISKAENALSSSLDQVTSTITGIIKNGNEAVESLTGKVLSSVDQSGAVVSNKLGNLPSDLKEASSKAGVVGLDLLRKTIVVVEDSLVKGSKFVYYSYQSSKEFLPQEIQDAIISFEKGASEISRPVSMVFLQVYSAIEGLERSLGFDPSDPIIPFVLLLGTASTLWAVYWMVTYSGYAGDLSPKLAFELLTGRDNAVLIDVRPEDMRELNGIPDLRRSARSRYGSVSLPEVDSSLRKLMKSSRELDDALIATVIRNLKNVRDSSKIIVMDADGSHAKGIARSLKKLGTKRPYVLHGGFQSWVKQGLRVKELKPETAITILNEEAKAILEELSPTPVQLLGFGVGSVAALYAFVEWEKTLQLIGVFSLCQIIYSRLASYEDSEDFRKDVRLLLSPVTLGAQAVSRVVRKVEANGNGLPLSPSSSDVQSRVLQAAAKHESQPFDAEGSQDPLLDSTTAVNELNVDVSEA